MKVELITHTTGGTGSYYEGKSLDEIVVVIEMLSTSRIVEYNLNKLN